MKNKKLVTSFVTLLALGSLAACGNANEPTASTETEASSKTTASTETKKKQKKKTSSADWSDVETLVKEKTEAKDMETLYKNDDERVFENEQVAMKINGYRYYEISDFSRDFKIAYGDQTETGGVIVLDVTLENKSDEPVYTSAAFYGQVVGFSSAIGPNKQLLDDDTNLSTKLYDKENKLEEKESLQGYVALNVKPEAQTCIEKTGELNLDTLSFNSEKDSTTQNTILKSEKTVLPLSKEGAQNVAAAGAFYPDKASADNMGTKTMLAEKELNETKEFEGVKVTLDGYQFTELVPNDDQASRFSNFETGVVLMTSKVTLKNEGSETLDFSSTSATLTMGSSVKLLSNSMLHPRYETKELASGAEDTLYLVFIMDKESYDKLYSTQDYTLAITLYDEAFKRLDSDKVLSYEFAN